MHGGWIRLLQTQRRRLANISGPASPASVRGSEAPRWPRSVIASISQRCHGEDRHPADRRLTLLTVPGLCWPGGHRPRTSHHLASMHHHPSHCHGIVRRGSVGPGALCRGSHGLPTEPRRQSRQVVGLASCPYLSCFRRRVLKSAARLAPAQAVTLKVSESTSELRPVCHKLNGNRNNSVLGRDNSARPALWPAPPAACGQTARGLTTRTLIMQNFDAAQGFPFT